MCQKLQKLSRSWLKRIPSVFSLFCTNQFHFCTSYVGSEARDFLTSPRKCCHISLTESNFLAFRNSRRIFFHIQCCHVAAVLLLCSTQLAQSKFTFDWLQTHTSGLWMSVVCTKDCISFVQFYNLFTMYIKKKYVNSLITNKLLFLCI